MSAREQREIEAIAEDIVDHLRRHPRAADSAAGVAGWWLAPERAGAALEQVESALDLLVSRGVLQRLPLTDGGVLYSHIPSPQQ